MTVLFVHGNPESEAVWGPLVAELGRDDAVCLSPPGFGAPLPDGFGATMTEYRDWLVTEIQARGEPVHLVGHDWGGGHVVNVAMSRPDLLRSWTTDVIGVFDPDYVWHELAQVWQTPVEGEKLVDSMLAGTPEQRAERLVEAGLPDRTVARKVAEAHDANMRRAILALYRSAAQPVLAEQGRQLPTAAQRPGLSLLATEDDYVGSDQMRRRAADRAGARTEVLEGLGHWWMVEDPARGAAALNSFWASLPG